MSESKNPYAKMLQKQVAINIDAAVMDYFKEMSASNGIPCQTLINMYLTDCAVNKRKLQIAWA